MDTADYSEPSSLLESFCQHPRIVQAILHDGAVSIKPKVDKVIVLGDDLGTRTGEVESIRLFRAAQIMQLEYQVIRQIGPISPNDPANPGIYQSILVAGGIDGFDTWELKVPETFLSKSCKCKSVRNTGRTISDPHQHV